MMVASIGRKSSETEVSEGAAVGHHSTKTTSAARSPRRIRFGRLRWWVEESPPAFSAVALLALLLLALVWVLTAVQRKPQITAVELTLQPVAVAPPEAATAPSDSAEPRERPPELEAQVTPLDQPEVEVGRVEADVREFRPEKAVKAAEETAQRLQTEAAQARDYLEKLKEALGAGAGKPAAGRPGVGDPNSTAARIARWVIRYPRVRPVEYAHLLDYFGVELGWLAGGGKIQYVSRFTGELRRRQGSYRYENRAFWYPVGNYAPLDERLLSGLGIRPGGTIIHFYPKRVERELAELEQRALRERHGTDDLQRIEQTVFGIRRRGNGWQFYVAELRLAAPNPLDHAPEN